MQIQNNNIYFGNTTRTANLFEAMLCKNFESNDIGAFKRIYEDLAPENKFVGKFGFKGYFERNLLKKILNKYPQLEKDIEEIKARKKNKVLS